MIRNARINVQEGEKYPADDIPEKVLQWIENNKRHVDPERTDLVEGQTVVILYGKYTSQRAIFVKRLPKNLILVAGPSHINGVSLTVLNQRYVLPVSVFVQLDRSMIDAVQVKKDEIEAIRDWTTENAYDLEILNLIDTTGIQEHVNEVVDKECAKTKGLKTYFKTPFTLPRGDIDPASAFY